MPPLEFVPEPAAPSLPLSPSGAACDVVGVAGSDGFLAPVGSLELSAVWGGVVGVELPLLLLLSAPKPAPSDGVLPLGVDAVPPPPVLLPPVTSVHSEALV